MLRSVKFLVIVPPPVVIFLADFLGRELVCLLFPSGENFQQFGSILAFGLREPVSYCAKRTSALRSGKPTSIPRWNMMAGSYGFTKFFAANMCLIGFCKITAKLDSYMGSLGVNLERIGGGMSGLGALLMAGRLMNFGGGRKSASGGDSRGHMNFAGGQESAEAFQENW